MRRRLSDEEAMSAARALLGKLPVEALSGLAKAERDEAVGRLRLTGISLGVISKARPLPV